MFPLSQLPDFEKSLKFVLEQEDGFSDDPTDSGGRTNFGITEAEYNIWRHANNLSGHEDILNITQDQYTEIYQDNYWLPAHCGLLEWPANLALFDSVVNCGLSRGIKFLQRALSITDDGVPGEETQADMSHPALDPVELTNDICSERDNFYREIAQHPGQSVFLKGWLNRVNNLRIQAAND